MDSYDIFSETMGMPEDPPPSELTETDRIVKIVGDVFLTYLAGIAMITGIITSVLSLLLFRQDSRTSRSTRLLLSMVALSDFNLLVSVLFFYLVREAIPKDSHSKAFFEHPVVFSLLFYVSNVFELFRNWLLVVISFERLLFFIKPVEVKTFWRYQTVKAVIAGLVGFSLLARLPSGVYAFTENFRPKPADINRVSKLLHTATDCVLLTSLPITLMTCICIVTTSRIHRFMRTKRRLKKVFISFSLPSIPASGLQFYIAYTDVRSSVLLWTMQILRAIGNFTSMLSSTSNFFVYIFQSKRYRAILAQILHLDKIYPRLKQESTITPASLR
ncbi:unnamed protein product [Dibothriocephalus latus]|uniref:G-protein coupled receptors family 1 profile domain-containing protein n=1 Tax=Dibothriocephalus latus TaxID=60516 RepID=A0A3P7L101_DIBLA|nr:unnamed protein product [Dibothriocephalus latus]